MAAHGLSGWRVGKVSHLRSPLKQLDRSIIQIAIVFAAAASASGVMAQISAMSGNNLYNNCAAKADGPNAEMHAYLCLGYVTGVLDAVTTGNLNGHRACVPPNVNMSQIVDIIKNAIQGQPARRHLVGINLAAEALETAFPCPQKLPR
jgi:hypothetical protein